MGNKKNEVKKTKTDTRDKKQEEREIKEKVNERKKPKITYKNQKPNIFKILMSKIKRFFSETIPGILIVVFSKEGRRARHEIISREIEKAERAERVEEKNRKRETQHDIDVKSKTYKNVFSEKNRADEYTKNKQFVENMFKLALEEEKRDIRIPLKNKDMIVIRAMGDGHFEVDRAYPSLNHKTNAVVYALSDIATYDKVKSDRKKFDKLRLNNRNTIDAVVNEVINGGGVDPEHFDLRNVSFTERNELPRYMGEFDINAPYVEDVVKDVPDENIIPDAGDDNGSYIENDEPGGTFTDDGGFMNPEEMEELFGPLENPPAEEQVNDGTDISVVIDEQTKNNEQDNPSKDKNKKVKDVEIGE